MKNNPKKLIVISALSIAGSFLWSHCYDKALYKFLPMGFLFISWFIIIIASITLIAGILQLILNTITNKSSNQKTKEINQKQNISLWKIFRILDIILGLITIFFMTAKPTDDAFMQGLAYAGLYILTIVSAITTAIFTGLTVLLYILDKKHNEDVEQEQK